MAVNTVTVHQNNIVLPNGQVYQTGTTASLSDDEFAQIMPSLFTGSTPIITINSQNTLHSVVVDKNNVVLPNGQVYQNGNTAVLSDNQYATLAPITLTDGTL